ncbi:molybdopterin-dependent oxidoreductase [Verrucomicrobium sp. BvORR106]|uniref:molybdopterin-dependent oxidoreductase n=1 Tax=Verrucomicrobium sp. BvORR106 TaxID=1403819 RepID=UPI000690E1F3|nr:molybdopterin-dependent oxidoreductase [Verrucomicrobium sp. BvORR106]
MKMNATLDRRELLKLSALAGAAAVAASRAGVAAPVAPSGVTAANPDAGIKWDKAPCRFCGTGCHVRVGVKEDRVVAIEGEPLAEVNKGLLCVKGYHVGLALYGRDRLTHPMLRKNGKMERVSWEEAVDVVAKRVLAAPDKFAIYGSGQWTIPEGYVANKLMKAGLSNNHIEPNARLCMASAVTGFLSVYGVDEPAGAYDDLDHCDVLILWGNNMAEMHPVLFSRVIDRRARGGKVKIIDLGTRRTRSSEFADHYLEFKPNGDLAIANGIAHLLIKNGTYDKAFVEQHCNFRQDKTAASLNGESMTFEEYKMALAPFTPEHVAELSGVPAEQIHMLADLFGRRDLHITSTWCMGFNQHNRATDINRLCHSIHLLSGHFGKPGDAPTSLTGQPSACGTAREVGTMCHFLPGGRLVENAEHRAEAEQLWNVPAGRLKPKMGYHTVLMWEKFCTPTNQGGDISTIWVQVTNPGQSLPNLHKLFQAKKGLEDKFLIVSDVYPTATTELADLVLPSAMWVEKNGLYGNSERRTQQWFKMVNPPGEARDDAWQNLAVARRLHDLGHPGLKDKDGKFLFTFQDDAGKEVPVWEWPRYYEMNVDKVLFEDYRRFSRVKHKDLAPYDEYVKARGLRWPVVQQADGTWRETRFRFAEFDDPYVKKGAGVQFYHSSTKDDRAQVWFAPYTPPAEVPDADYPFWLCTGRVLEHWHTGTMTMRIPQLHGAVPYAYVEMHAADAEDRDIGNGDSVLVKTRRGELRLPVWVNGRSRPPRGSLFIPFFDERLLCNLLTLEVTCPISKEPDYKKCAATVVKAGPQAGKVGSI